MPQTLAARLAELLQARVSCRLNGNAEWEARHTDEIAALCREHLPCGSGFDNGSALAIEASFPERLVFTTAFHHMNDHGMYDGWTEHRVTVVPTFGGLTVSRVTGRNRNDIKESIAEAFQYALSRSAPTQVSALMRLHS